MAGLRTALVLEPLIHPGVRHRLLAVGDGWCGVEAFNTAWSEAGAARDAVAVASAYASLAAAPYFDG